MAEYSGSSGYAEYEYLGTANGTSFAKRHPYLLWQIIGWSILLADAVFFVVAGTPGLRRMVLPGHRIPHSLRHCSR